MPSKVLTYCLLGIAGPVISSTHKQNSGTQLEVRAIIADDVLKNLWNHQGAVEKSRSPAHRWWYFKKRTVDHLLISTKLRGRPNGQLRK